MEQFVTPQEAAQMLKRSRRTVYRMMKSGMFKNMRSFGEGHRKVWFIDRSEIEAILARRGASAQRQATAEQQQLPAELPRLTVDLVNLTPHEITVYTSTQQRAFSVPPLGVVARVERTYRQVAVLNGVPVFETTSVKVVGLPASQPGIAYIVAEEVLAAVPDRDDVYAPGQALRAPDGRAAGCVGLRTRRGNVDLRA